MKALVTCLILAVCAGPVLAQESSGLRIKPKVALPSSSPSTSASSSAPFHAAAVPDLPTLTPHAGMEREPIPGSCKVSASMVCYDYKDGRAVFKPARNLMPEISGMRRESLTLKRDKITLNYSFK
jgi:hypothetical protein